MENNSNYAAGYTYGTKEEVQVSLRVQFGKGAKKVWETIQSWSEILIGAFRTVGMRFFKGLMYVATRTVEVAGTCVSAVPSIIATTVRVVFGVLKWTVNLFVAGVLVIAGLAAGLFILLGNGMMAALSWISDTSQKVARSSWRLTKRVSRSRKLSHSFKSTKSETHRTTAGGSQAQAA